MKRTVPRCKENGQSVGSPSEVLVAPHLLDYEVLSVIRRLVLRGELSAGRAHAALEDFALFQWTTFRGVSKS